MQRIKREVRLLKTLHHPHIVKLLDVRYSSPYPINSTTINTRYRRRRRKSSS